MASRAPGKLSSRGFSLLSLTTSMNALNIDSEDRATFGAERMLRSLSPLRLSLAGDLSEVAEALLSVRALQAFDQAAARYPIYRLVRSTSRRPLDEVFDDLATGSGLAAHRLGETSLVLDGQGTLVTASGHRKSDYSSLTFSIWAESMPSLIFTRDRLLDIAGDRCLRLATFTIDWHFTRGPGVSASARFEEMADPEVLDEAYPTLGEPIARFVERYLAARDTVLILQGPPGTGKTRFVRAILAAISRRKGASAQVLYTADTGALENDRIFVQFLTGDHDAFVIEDADHILDSRRNGNRDLHRFLSIADGVVRAQGRKIVFTTNLPNVADIDDALLRPGRCFANLHFPALERPQAERLVARLCGSDSLLAERVLKAALSGSSATLASIYRAEAAERAATSRSPAG